jgi:hypothetical protein
MRVRRRAEAHRLDMCSSDFGRFIEKECRKGDHGLANVLFPVWKGGVRHRWIPRQFWDTEPEGRGTRSAFLQAFWFRGTRQEGVMKVRGGISVNVLYIE